MKVHLNRSEETKGMFKKKTMYWVTCRVEFTAEEAKTIKDRKIQDVIVYKYHISDWNNITNTPMEFDYDIKIEDFYKDGGHKRWFNTTVDAQNFEQELREKYLPNIKSYIEASGAPTTKSDSFEL